jgi:hypothetical protein
MLEINEDGSGFFANNYNILVYSLPLIIMIEVIFFSLFHLTKNHPFSKIFRKYYFFGILLFMFFEGNIEQYCFYFFEEFSLFFSANFTHKLMNIFLLLFFFVTVFMCVGSYIWFKAYYEKKAKYFT